MVRSDMAFLIKRLDDGAAVPKPPSPLTVAAAAGVNTAGTTARLP